MVEVMVTVTIELRRSDYISLLKRWGHSGCSSQSVSFSMIAVLHVSKKFCMELHRITLVRLWSTYCGRCALHSASSIQLAGWPNIKKKTFCN